ncbi:MAG: NUDIX domain-containing protein [Spirochaetales bacterium]|nr:NUDIX domain-containing protein [Spirochaetales bacterium]
MRGTGSDGSPDDGEVLVVGAVVERDGRLFLARRAAGERHGGRWELPGGKVERGESPERALARELREELAVEAEVSALVAESAVSIEGKRYRFLALEAAFDRDPVAGPAHSGFGWFEPESLPDENDLAPLDAPALEAWLRRAGKSES